ncbi:response regulator [Bacteroides thetaiotaomicron]|uniref:ATP-binding response regulator n=1 Tax=Bacteroides thetaiotaomicron TaxID=818 RepID=UPI001D08CAF2|nr:ATP-binding protein [Bacteroides thetaiotaomicron]MCB7008670.1 response regulator [Bacteroides thetaiotaomicron]MCB7364843.1 response regulator [Bacteroides thetaiotaomicron]MCQ5020857.1 ATP-binding protein [Bacteroides thetaiotaomicron]MCQ5109684.1 ATP-binding protein [Bacteroides thetaiotaomicron]
MSKMKPEMTNKALHRKIAFSFAFFVLVIVCMAGIVFIERKRLMEIEENTSAARKTHWDIYYAHQYITRLAMLGETVAGWNCSDYDDYHKTTLLVDSILHEISKGNPSCVPSEQIDSLRTLLHTKELHMYLLMRAFHRLSKSDSLLITGLQTINSHAIDGLVQNGKSGLFPMPQIMELKFLNEDLIRTQEKRMFDFEDGSRRISQDNANINARLLNLIATLDSQVRKEFRNKERNLDEMRQTSMNLISIIIVTTCLLLVLAYVLIQRDVRQRIEIQKRLEESLKQNRMLLSMREKVLLTVSHDIRGPLNTITGSAELAQNTRDRKKRNCYITNILDTSRHILKLVNNLLDLSRLNQSKETPNLVSFHLEELLQRIVSLYSQETNKKGLLFRYSFDNLPTAVLNDPDRIEQVLDNLISNAIKFTPDGTVCLQASYHQGILLLRVQDTGIGMNQLTIRRVFNPFEKAAPHISAEGFGLGLSIVKGIVNLLGGKISVSSTEGIGSCFEVSIPMSETNLNKEIPSPVRTFSGILPKRVIAIDDDPLQLAVMKEMLERNGVDCITCSTAKDVVKAMREKDYDLLLSDIQMIGTSGFELLDLLRNSTVGNSRTIPVVAMTARGDRGNEVFLKAGFAACIYKPFSSSELISLLSTITTSLPVERKRIDFSAMLSEVSDKKRQLDSFISQSEMDKRELDTALKLKDRKKLLEITHRMQPMWELLQMKELLSAYRVLLRDSTTNDDAIQKYTQQIIECTGVLIIEAENEIKRLTNETENTDS